MLNLKHLKAPDSNGRASITEHMIAHPLTRELSIKYLRIIQLIWVWLVLLIYLNNEILSS